MIDTISRRPSAVLSPAALCGALLLSASLVAPPAAAAQDSEGMTLETKTELSFVATGGNASSSTLGLKASLEGTSEDSGFKLEFGGVRAESQFRTRTALGTPDDFDVTEEVRTERTAASYFARSRYDRNFGPSFAFGSAGWTRNTFAGLKNRYSFALGGGRQWIDSDGAKFKTDLAATYTIQKDVDPSADFDDAFLGLRISVEAFRQLTETTEMRTEAIFDQNGEKTEDFRADWTTSLAVAISDGLALQTSLQLLFDNDPSQIGVPLESEPGVPAGAKVLVDGKELDRVLTVALVITL